MSKIAIKGNESGTATFTIQAPATNTNRIFELPDEAGKVLTDASDIEPQVKTATNASGNAPIYACRAWVNFDGTTTAPAIRGSGNVSSVTRNGAGDYTVNFTTAMEDADYSYYSNRDGDNIAVIATSGSPTTTSLRVRTGFVSSTAESQADASEVLVAIFR